MHSCPQYRLLGRQYSQWHLEWTAFCLPLQWHRLLFPVTWLCFHCSDLLVSGSGPTCEAGHGNQGRRPVRPRHFGRLHSVSQLCRGKYRKICLALLWIFSSCLIFIQIVLWKGYVGICGLYSKNLNSVNIQTNICWEPAMCLILTST